MRQSYLLVGIGSIVFAVLMWFHCKTSIPFQSLKEGLGPAFFPALLLAVLMCLGIASLVLAKATPKSTHTNSLKSNDRNIYRYFNVISVFFLLIIYGILFSKAGFFISSIIFLFVCMLILKVKFFVALSFSAIISGSIYILFVWLLKVPLP